jgi:hypothetical protein
MTTGRTKAERRVGSEVECFATFPPVRMAGAGPDGEYNAFKIKFRPDDNAHPDKEGRRLVSRLLFLPGDVDAVRKIPGFIACAQPNTSEIA